jgi:hypothetical protein
MTSPGIRADKYVLNPAIAERITGITAAGINGRGPSSLCRWDIWQRAVELIQDMKKIAVISGFYVPSAALPESDGPTGSVALARTLSRLGKDVVVWTDELCLDCMKKCAKLMNFPQDKVLKAPGMDRGRPDEDLLIYVERLGRAADGAYYNMAGEDISRWTEPLDSFALDSGMTTIGIGDGGNEVGMGSLIDQLRKVMPGYASCLCVVRADVCIPVDVSNWGAYGLSAALSSVAGRWLAQDEDEERSALAALGGRYAVDGITKKKEASVDGFPLERHTKIIADLKSATGLQ